MIFKICDTVAVTGKEYLHLIDVFEDNLIEVCGIEVAFTFLIFTKLDHH
jgi:hypothetical protein